MDNRFFELPILNSPYRYPSRHWELDANGRPTGRVLESRRRAEFITPVPKPKKRKGGAEQASLVFDEGQGLSMCEQIGHFPRTSARNGQEASKRARRTKSDGVTFGVTFKASPDVSSVRI